ncbi:unnamed protein product [Zymoseptoria tritici ST99CH_3D7]|uniref:Uncharacterized protein n=1 Tax=Zymoseptoria tritici (strain ST99CH_3D7) TaxID=1276538 RepID=A0A1X7RKQ2_ZYMT9|nr:unnamed protein product [Zymoseptoria tritici ST99CH_3D7]
MTLWLPRKGVHDIFLASRHPVPLSFLQQTNTSRAKEKTKIIIQIFQLSVILSLASAALAGVSHCKIRYYNDAGVCPVGGQDLPCSVDSKCVHHGHKCYRINNVATVANCN